jgi:hypothetical protein
MGLALSLLCAGCQPSQKKDADTNAGEATAADDPATKDVAKDEAPRDAVASDAPPAPDATAPDATAPDATAPDAAAPDATATSDATASSKVVLGSDELFAGIPGEGELTDEQIDAWLNDPKNHEPLEFRCRSRASTATR